MTEALPLRLSDTQLREMTEFEARWSHEEPPERAAWRLALLDLVLRRKWFLLIDAVLLLWSLWRGVWWVGVLALLCIAVEIGVPFWAARRAGGPILRSTAYVNLLRAQALGQWDQAQRLIAVVREGQPMHNLEYDLDVRAAWIALRIDPQLPIPDDLLHWRGDSPEAHASFEGRMAGLHFAAQRFPAMIAAMRRAHDLLPGDAAKALDLAVVEARYGNIDEAARLIAALDAAAIPAHGQPFLELVRGLVAAKREEPSALTHLAAAVDGFHAHAHQPAVWAALAMASGDYAVALKLAGQASEARRVSNSVWPILRHYGHPQQLKFLRLKPRTAD